MHPSIAAAIIDLDGTLIDTVGDFEVALRLAFADLGLPAAQRAFITCTVGKGSEHLIAQSLAHVGGRPEQFDAAWQRYQHHYLAINGQHSALYPGVLEGLHMLRARGLRLVCLTNKPTAFALPLLAAKSIDKFFEAVYGGDAFEHKKPHPMPLLKACAAMGLAPAQVLMVGDSSNDAQAARAAGCPVVLMSYGYNHGEPIESAGADAVLDRLDALGDFL